MENEFPSNSIAAPRKPKRAEPEKKDIKKVVTGKVITRKPPLRKRFLQDLFGRQENQGVGEYILLDVLAPGIRDMVADLGISTIERAMGRDTSRRGRGGHIPFNRMSEARPRAVGGRGPRERPRKSSTLDHEELILETRAEAEQVVDDMFELLSRYGVVTVQDLNGMLGKTPEYTDNDWGWVDLRGARIHRAGGGYLLDLPRPQALED